LTAVAALTVAGCAGGSSDKPTGSDAASKASKSGNGGLLFAMSAETGTLDPRPSSPGQYALSLQRLNGRVTVFSDRPERRAGTESAARFVAQWEARGFKADPPNAALELIASDDSHVSQVFELAEPAFDPTSDRLTFTARKVGSSESGALVGFGSDDADLPNNFGESSLFVDSAFDGTSCSLYVSDFIPTADGSLSVPSVSKVQGYDQSLVAAWDPNEKITGGDTGDPSQQLIGQTQGNSLTDGCGLEASVDLIDPGDGSVAATWKLRIEDPAVGSNKWSCEKVYTKPNDEGVDFDCSLYQPRTTSGGDLRIGYRLGFK
jgi:hypothetical protein